MNSIIIHCDGGFGNRFNALISGLTLARRLNHKVVIHWPITTFCRARFDSLFEPFVDFIEELPNIENYCCIAHMPNQKTKEYYNLENIDTFTTFEGLVSNKNVLFGCCNVPKFIPNQLHNELEVVKKIIQFKSSIVETANEIISTNTSGDYHGMHLRKTDFHALQTTANMESYFRDLIKNEPEKTFFICSDDESTELDLAKNNNVFRFNKTSYVEKYKEGAPWRGILKLEDGQNLDFNVDRDQQSVVEAVIDLIILSRSNILTSDTGSTFLDVAHLMKDFI